VIWCLRISPLIAAALLALRGRWLVGLFSSAGTRGVAAGHSAVLSPSALYSLGLSPSALYTSAVNLLRGSGTLVSQFFAWLYLLVGLCAVCGLIQLVVGEVRLRREFSGRLRGRRGRRGRARWGTPAGRTVRAPTPVRTGRDGR
jgi:thiosulfate reductase cytochrome b subunit